MSFFEVRAETLGVAEPLRLQNRDVLNHGKYASLCWTGELLHV